MKKLILVGAAFAAAGVIQEARAQDGWENDCGYTYRYECNPVPRYCDPYPYQFEFRIEFRWDPIYCPPRPYDPVIRTPGYPVRRLDPPRRDWQRHTYGYQEWSGSRRSR